MESIKKGGAVQIIGWLMRQWSKERLTLKLDCPTLFDVVHVHFLGQVGAVPDS